MQTAANALLVVTGRQHGAFDTVSVPLGRHGIRNATRMTPERKTIRRLFARLGRQPRRCFPPKGIVLDAPKLQGVYIIRKGNAIFHVGRTTRAKHGLHQRLTAHLRGRSSFTRVQFKRKGDRLREGYEYQVLVVRDARHRALLEAYAAGSLCPKHLGTGE